VTANWHDIFKEQGAIWIHDGNPQRPHALLTSGLHSDGFVNCSLVTQHARLLEQIVTDETGLAPKLPGQADWVIGSALGAVTFAHAVALKLGARAGFTEKDGEAMKLARFEVKPGQRVLVVEDTISTGGSTLKTIEGIRNAGVPESAILPFIVCLVNRSGSATLGGRELRALLTLDIHNWKAEDCPLCKAGSQALRPKANWNALTAQY
jgi:orotate phosphoribosyltransferase